MKIEIEKLQEMHLKLLKSIIWWFKKSFGLCIKGAMAFSRQSSRQHAQRGMLVARIYYSI